MRTFDLRFERTQAPKIDMQMAGDSLAEAQGKAEWWYSDRFKNDGQAPATGSTTYDWRGAVCFVDCEPAEESITCLARYNKRVRGVALFDSNPWPGRVAGKAV